MFLRNQWNMEEIITDFLIINMNWSEYNLRSINCIDYFFVFDILLESRLSKNKRIIHVVNCCTFECLFDAKSNKVLSLPIKNVIINREDEYYNLTVLFDSSATGGFKALKCDEIIVENYE